MCSASVEVLAMKGQLVVVKDFRGVALIRRVWTSDESAVYISDEQGFEALQRGVAGALPVGFPRRDVFVLEDGFCPDRVDWSRMTPWESA